MTREETILDQIKLSGLYYLGDGPDVDFKTVDPYTPDTDKSVMEQVLENCSNEEWEGLLELAVSHQSGWSPEVTELLERTGCDNVKDASAELDAIMYSLKYAYENQIPIDVGDTTIADNAKRFQESLVTHMEEQTSNVAFVDEIDVLIEYKEVGLLKYLKQQFIEAGVEVPEKLLPY